MLRNDSQSVFKVCFYAFVRILGIFYSLIRMGNWKRKTDQGVSDFDALMRAIKEIKVNKKPITTVARAYNVPKSSMFRYIKKLDAIVPDIAELDDDELTSKIREIASYAVLSVMHCFMILCRASIH